MKANSKFLIQIGIKAAIEEEGENSGAAYNLENALYDFNHSGNSEKMKEEIKEFRSGLMGSGSLSANRRRKLEIIYDQVIEALEDYD